MKKSAKFSLLSLAVIFGIAGASTYQRKLNEERLFACNNGEKIESCEKIEHLAYWKGKITNHEWQKNKALEEQSSYVKGCLNDNDFLQRYNCKKVDFALLTGDEWGKVREKYDLLIDSDGEPNDWTINNVKQLREKESDPVYQAEQRKKAEKEKLKSEGWWEPKSGILVRWCNNSSYRYPDQGDCPMTESWSNTVWRMMVWCRDRRCGNIYGKINIMQGANGPVIGWTNDTAYGDLGQKVILTFQSSSSGRGRLVEFTTY